MSSITVKESANSLAHQLAELSGAVVRAEDVPELMADFSEVPAFLRSLLVADGTVTMALEAFFLEDVLIETLQQGVFTLPEAIPVLDVAAGDRGFYREVRLVGADSATEYARAFSVLNSAAIEPTLFDHLVDERVGIGVILRNFSRGSHREVLDIRRGGLMSAADVSRSYRVSLNEQPAILITEEFDFAPYAPSI